jgi:hypothetical protein
MSGEIKSWWQARIANLERDRFFNKRYANCAKEPKELFDRIGEDLDSSNEAIRNKAYWALVLLTPELINLLHEKETRNPGWGDREGKDQKMVNEGLDGSKCILKHLHTKLVKEHRFKVRDGYKKDPRPFLREAIKNWEKDRDRKLDREVPLDYEAALEIPDPAGSPEDYIIRTPTYWDLRREYCDGGIFRDGDKFDLFYTFNVDERPLEEIRERWGIPSDEAVRQQKSRINKEIVVRRDALFASLLIEEREFARTGKIPRNPKAPERSEEWAQRTKRSVQPGAWANGKVPDGKNAIAVRPLTRSLGYAPAHIYLVVAHYNEVAPWHKRDPFWVHVGFSRTKVPLPLNEHIQKVINPTGEFQRSLFTHRLLEAYPTELPGLNEALGDANVCAGSAEIGILACHFELDARGSGSQLLRGKDLLGPSTA